MRKAFWMAGAAAAGVGAGVAAYTLLVRPWHLRWGAADDEVRAPLPGDEFVPSPKDTSTHAITIDAPVGDVWPWLAQIGQDKGGFYSYTWLENLVGCRMRNADRVLPEFQEVRVGDTVRLHPKVPPLPVLLVEPERALVMGSNTRDPGTWGLYLKPLSEDQTRLIVRGRGDWNADPLNWVVRRVLFEPIHFVMERKMLLGIRARAEQGHGVPATEGTPS